MRSFLHSCFLQKLKNYLSHITECFSQRGLFPEAIHLPLPSSCPMSCKAMQFFKKGFTRSIQLAVNRSNDTDCMARRIPV